MELNSISILYERFRLNYIKNMIKYMTKLKNAFRKEFEACLLLNLDKGTGIYSQHCFKYFTFIFCIFKATIMRALFMTCIACINDRN